MAVVQTVRGPVEAADLGPTLTHEHVVVSSPEFARDFPDLSWNEGRARAVERVTGVLRGVAERGIRTVVDCTAIFHGRDMAFVQEVNAGVDLHIVVSTGIYTPDYLPYYVFHRPPGDGRDVLTEMFVRDLTEGVSGTGVRAQNIKVATDVAGVTPNNDRILRAAAAAARETGAPITTHTHAANRAGLDQQRIFAEEGVDLSGVVIGHSGDSTDLDYLRALMDAGSFVASDRFGLNGAGRATEEQRVATVATLCAQGYADRILLSHDTLLCVDWLDSLEHYPDTWVPTHISDVVLPALAKAGVPDTDLETMMVGNAARLLARNDRTAP